ncbi:Fc.00g099500.m01.CDS01 [Cosmosporella sp. VM-42]
MSRSRVPLILGGTAAAGVGYYFYAAGGNAKAAENKFESDAHRAAASVKSHLPGSSPINAEKDAKNYGREAGAKVDNALAEADKQIGRAQSNAKAYAKDTKAEALKAVDKFDTTVEKKTAEAKSGISSWFGFGGK